MSGYADYKHANETGNVERVECEGVVGPLINGIGFLFDPADMPELVAQDLKLADGQTVTVDRTKAAGTFETGWAVERHGKILKCKNHAVDSSPYEVAVARDDGWVVTRELNHHPDSSQTFVSFVPKSFGMFLAPPCKDPAGRAKFYVFDGTKGVIIMPGVWHQPPVSIDLESQTFYTEQLRSHNCVVYDCLTSSNCWLGFKKAR